MSSPKRLARIAGVLYLLNGVFSGFAFANVIGKVYVADDATRTAANIAANPGLVRAAWSPTSPMEPSGCFWR